MTPYKEFTFGWIAFIVLTPIQGFNTYLYLSQAGSQPLPLYPFLIITLLIVIIVMLFYGLTTRITSAAIVVSFGIGLIRKKIDLKRIKSVKAVQSPWYYGWGLRWIPNGMLYNISGTDGVELRFHDTGRILRIGTKNSANLKKEIEKRMPKEGV